MGKKTPAFFTLFSIYQAMARTAREYNVREIAISNNSYSATSSKSVSHRLREPIVVTNTNLIDLCTRYEWHLLGKIMSELYEYNALWKADMVPFTSNSQYRKAIRSMVKKGILSSTETSGMFIVNPQFMRRGDPFAVTATTANMLMNRKPNDTMLCDKRPVTHFDFSLAGLPDPGTT